MVAGYFKARRKFFAGQFRQTDIGYVARQIGVNPADVCIGAYSKETYARHQRAILGYFGCSPFDEAAKAAATVSEIAKPARVQLRPKPALLETIQALTRKKIAIPSYNVLADLIVAALDRPFAAVDWEDELAPPPSIIVVNCANGHAHLLYAIETPVFNAANHPKPLRLAAAIQEALRQKLGGDPGYSGLIAKNPLHPHWRVIVHPGAVYDLAYLSEWVDLDHRPAKPLRGEERGLGRNCALFDRLRHWAYRWIATYKDTATADEWGRAVFAQAQKSNDFNTPLHESEVRAIAKSTAKWCWNRFVIKAKTCCNASRAGKLICPEWMPWSPCGCASPATARPTLREPCASLPRRCAISRKAATGATTRSAPPAMPLVPLATAKPSI